jgi:hypothetical protein
MTLFFQLFINKSVKKMGYDFDCEECGGPGYGFLNTICSACRDGVDPFPTCAACNTEIEYVRWGSGRCHCMFKKCSELICHFCDREEKICIKCKDEYGICDYFCKGCKGKMWGDDETTYCYSCEQTYGKNSNTKSESESD